jgi:hypothetical protein
MTPDARRFSVDLDKLDSLAARIRGFAGFIDDQLKAIDGKAKEAEGHWTGAQRPPTATPTGSGCRVRPNSHTG